ncbi:MAG: hypothetical protein IPP94_12900 [Ignavibacteria bacterium]|nr:hypothetical protein [Ignavibacteria bacterium]
MNATELLHQYFDEGLDPAHEDVLFERLAASQELRKEFSEHARLHSFISQDLRNITPPAAVTAAVFAGAGLTAPAAAAATAGAASSGPMHAAHSALAVVKGHLPIIATAILSAVMTSGMFLLFSPAPILTLPPGQQEARLQQTPTEAAPISADRIARDAENAEPASARIGRARHARTAGPVFADTRAAAQGSGAAVAHGAMERSDRTGDGTPPSVAEAAHAAVTLRPPPADLLPSTVAELPIGADRYSALPADLDIAPAPLKTPTREDIPVQPVAVFPPDAMLADASMDGLSRSHFFQYHSNGDFLSNLVFEMRVLNSRSYPSVDLPYNSHDLFKDMAISAVYKISDMHAFGLEYGRETFGQEYQSMMFFENRDPGEPIRIVYSPPAPWIAAIVQRNKMLDWYGAVWKLSFPKFGIVDFVYPYARTVIGGTRQGPLAKFRFGLEMYPTNYSMFNLGLEGSVLQYIVEGSWHRTYKLGATFGVAIGF